MTIELASGCGLDVGTSYLISARKQKDSNNIQYNEFRDAFYRIKASSPIAAKMIEKGLANKHYLKDQDGSFVVVGQDAIEKAIERHQSASRPMSLGVLSPKEIDARRVLKFILKEILGQPRSDGEKLVYSIPAQPIDLTESEFNTGFHQDAIFNDLKDLGYNPQAINEAEAICYSELETSDYTGIAYSFGAGTINICLMSAGEPVLVFAIAKGGDWIDRMAAQSVGEEDTVIQVEKEQGKWEIGSKNSSRILEAVSVYYLRLINYVTECTATVLSNSKTIPKFSHSVPIIISGGTSLAKGFLPAFEKSLSKRSLPFKISEIKAAQDPLRAVARGALLAAQL